MSTHDPRQVIEDLRNHLAMHDRHLSFLFGAGTSSSINIAPDPPAGEKPTHEPLIPGIDGLTEVCRTEISDMGENQAKAWEMLVKQCEQDPMDDVVEPRRRNLAGGEHVGCAPARARERRQVDAGERRREGVAHCEDEVRDDEPLQADRALEVVL